ncbi:hypothetical protein EDB85DRAFT_2142257 [Lactarius pseudohatsudake]|nr:hypothetical protein EDB85DRAFT_2142257 [Lactarius pseudohatsudake]
MKVCSNCRKPGHVTSACPLPPCPLRTTINEISVHSPSSPTTANDILKAALNLNPQECFHILNSLTLLEDTPKELDGGHQIGALYLPSPSSPSLLALFPSHDTFTLSLLLIPTSPHTSFTGLKTLPPDSPLGLSLAIDELPPDFISDVIDLTLDDIDDAANAVVFASCPPLLVPAVSSTLPPTSLVEDNTASTGGMKTIDHLVLNQNNAPTNLLIPQSPPYFSLVHSNDCAILTKLYQLHIFQ